jgi:hypothetical protein
MDDANYASRMARFNALLRLGQVPNVDNIDVEERKKALMGSDIDQEQLRQFAGDQMAIDRQGIDKVEERMGFDEEPTRIESKFTPEEMERKKQAIEMLMRGGK